MGGGSSEYAVRMCKTMFDGLPPDYPGLGLNGPPTWRSVRPARSAIWNGHDGTQRGSAGTADIGCRSPMAHCGGCTINRPHGLIDIDGFEERSARVSRAAACRSGRVLVGDLPGPGAIVLGGRPGRTARRARIAQAPRQNGRADAAALVRRMGSVDLDLTRASSPVRW